MMDVDELRGRWYEWRRSQDWAAEPIHLAAKVAEEAGEVLGATLKMDQNGRAGTHPEHDLPHLQQEIGQLVGTIFCLAEAYGIDPINEAELELVRVRRRFPGRAA